MTTTAAEVGLLRHACGMDSRDPYYRDYFAADPGSADDLAWAALVAKGLASVRREPGDPDPVCTLRIYGVTREGKALIGKLDQGEMFSK